MINVYKLEFKDGSIYVGKTNRKLNIRYNQHMTMMRKGCHHSHKVQAKYTMLGDPIIFLLEKVPDELGSICEKSWINKLDSYSGGLNCTLGGEGEYGEDHPNAQHSLIEYSNILLQLANTSKTLRKIADELHVSYNIVCSISSGNSHLYLEELYPLEYASMRTKASTRSVSSQRLEPYPAIVSPIGETYFIKNAMQFSKEHSLLHSELSNLLNHKSSIHRGWYLLDSKFPSVKSPLGEVFTILPKTAKEFAISQGLDPSNFTKLLRGASKSCKGWTLA